METVETKDALLSPELMKPRFTEALIPGLEKVVRFRSLSAFEHQELERLQIKHKKHAKVVPIALTVSNKEGLLIYSESDLTDLAKLDGRVVDHMIDVIQEHCVAKTSVADMVASAEKNSNGDQ